MRLGRLLVQGFRALSALRRQPYGSRANQRTRSINENGAEARHPGAIEWRRLGTEVVDDERARSTRPRARWVFCEQGIVILIFSYSVGEGAQALNRCTDGVDRPRFQCLLNM